MIAPALLLVISAAQGGADFVPVVLGRDFVVTDAATGEASRRRVVPYRPGAVCYSWTVRVRPEPRTVRVTERFTLPALARWTADGDSTIAADGSSAVTTIADDIADGAIGGGWCVAQGDPPGAYRIRVLSGSTLLATFDFVMAPDPASI